MSAGELKVLFFNWTWWEHALHHPTGATGFGEKTRGEAKGNKDMDVSWDTSGQ